MFIVWALVYKESVAYNCHSKDKRGRLIETKDLQRED